VSTLVLIDGPNLFNDVDRVLEKSTDPADTLRRAYFTNWFDVDRVVEATISQHVPDYRLLGLGVVIFHSDKALGRSAARLLQPATDTFWGRQSSAPGVSTILVSVPGQQPDKTTTCPHCEKEVPVEPRGEKGVDTSMVTYLYEALEQWTQAILFTNDADFVPPITALRRRGKRVFVASLPTPKVSALRRVSQSFFPIDAGLIERDFAAFRMLQPGGAFDRAFEAAAARYPGEVVQFSNDGPSCPMFLLKTRHPELEATLVGALNIAADQVAWFDSSRGREGRVFYPERHQLGTALQRHRDAFAGAKWLERWRDF